MTAVKSHRNITLWTYSEVQQVEGYVGNFEVKVRRKPRYVIEGLCVGCMECFQACVYKQAKVPDEFNLGLGKRKPIYIPFPQAVPQVVVIDPATCIEFKSGKCKKTCVEVCAERNAIDFKQPEEIKSVKVGAIILATGFEVFDARRIPYYGYGLYPNVYTALEIERLVNASGPTSGEHPARRPEAGDGRHRALRRQPGPQHESLLFPGLLHVLAETRAPDQRKNRGRGIQLLHRHARSRQGVRGVL
jgi:heterodisulfide reductase subunit A